MGVADEKESVVEEQVQIAEKIYFLRLISPKFLRTETSIHMTNNAFPAQN
jgi:hypothetical protein